MKYLIIGWSLGIIVGGSLLEVVVMGRMLGLSQARHWHVPKVQMEGYNYVMIVLSGGAPMCARWGHQVEYVLLYDG